MTDIDCHIGALALLGLSDIYMHYKKASLGR